MSYSRCFFPIIFYFSLANVSNRELNFEILNDLKCVQNNKRQEGEASWNFLRSPTNHEIQHTTILVVSFKHCMMPVHFMHNA